LELPATSLRAPRRRGRLDAEQARKLLNNMDISAVLGLRDRALINVMTFILW
jgi:site-specific recombinase XerC